MTQQPRAPYDVVVVGAGSAGLSAALVLARARRRVVVLDSGPPRHHASTHLHGFLSRDGSSPAELLAVGRREVVGYGGELRESAVTALRAKDGVPPGRRFVVELASGDTLEARRIMLCTGLRDELPDVPGLAERWGRDVLHCPYCHGREVAGRAIGVLGTSSLSVHQALLVRQWSERVVFFAHETLPLEREHRERLAAREVALVTGRVSGLVVEDDELRGVTVTPTEAAEAAADTVEVGDVGVAGTVSCAALFVSPLFTPHDGLVKALGCRTTARGWVETDDTGRTDVPGVWAAGNVNDPGAQVISSAGDGARAAVSVDADLLDEDVEEAVARHRRRTNGVPA